MASQKVIGEMLSLLTAQWPKEQVTNLTMKVYEVVLSDVPDDVLQAATFHLLSVSTFRPTAAEVRKAAFDLMRGKETSAIEAWGEVKRMVHRPASERHWTTPLIPEALRCVGGISAFAFSMVDDEPSWRARFMEAYNTLQERQRKDAMTLPQVKRLVAQRAALLEEGRQDE